MSDYDDPETEAQWCAERRQEVSDYLRGEGLAHGRVGEWPAWQVCPYVSVWAIESLSHPGAVGWWAISGDLPSDHVSSSDAKSPREAVRAIASLWQEAAECMARGERHPSFSIGSGHQDEELGPMLASRAGLLLEWVDDDEAWVEDGA
ncbi:DUF4826 family protein [Piscinibacter gummiphilus]|uniref:DUF4826 family protein n=1 Tax=Piscinibacter gummiphilus TaxID=946333 RepID=UPI000A26BA42|nr:DUF4826 family protein [Piscinibacter gummiphilus]ATU66998.1 DUF4826 domain-containing protein [Piscinibacter gummiphilus]GLS94426.1 hypothetical protein GCM10007918_17180 [Piscinibacter gummiphilus]